MNITKKTKIKENKLSGHNQIETNKKNKNKKAKIVACQLASRDKRKQSGTDNIIANKINEN